MIRPLHEQRAFLSLKQHKNGNAVLRAKHFVLFIEKCFGLCYGFPKIRGEPEQNKHTNRRL